MATFNVYVNLLEKQGRSSFNVHGRDSSDSSYNSYGQNKGLWEKLYFVIPWDRFASTAA